MIELSLPATPEEINLWIQVVAIWILILFGWRTVRWDWEPTFVQVAVIGLVTFVCGLLSMGPDFTSILGRLILGLSISTIAVLYLVFRRSKSYRIAFAVEIAVIPAILCSTGLVIGCLDLEVTTPLIRLDAGSETIYSSLVHLAAVPLLTGWSTAVIRDVLDYGRGREADRTEDDELNVGRKIGNVERVTIYVLVSIGAITAMVLVIAAKGLVRWPSVKGNSSDSRSEYFVVGNMMSLLLGLIIALFSRVAPV